MLPSQNMQNRLAKKKPMFVFDNFNVKSYSSHPIKPTKIIQPAARLVNAVIHGLNENRSHLPKIIVMIPDWDLVQNMCKITFGITIVLEIVIGWLVKAIDKAIQTRKDDLIKEKAGTVAYKEPKFLWIKMVDRHGVIDHALALCHKFNKVLENTLAKYHDHHITDISYHVNDASYFTPQLKEFNEDGAAKYWKEVDAQLKEFDRRERKFIPKKKQNKDYKYGKHRSSLSNRSSRKHHHKRRHHCYN